MAKSSSSPKAKMRSPSNSGGTWISDAPGSHHQAGVELGHRQAVIGEQQADVPVAQPLGAGVLVVAPPQRQAGEAAGGRGGHPLPEGDITPQGARAEHGVTRAERHHCRPRVWVTIVASVSENGTGAASGAHECAGAGA